MTKTKVADLEEIYNFVVDNFFSWNHLSKKNYVWISHIWNLKFSISYRKTTKTKVVVLSDICNFAVENFIIWIRLGSQILISKSGEVIQEKCLCSLNISDFSVEWYISDFNVEWLEKLCARLKVAQVEAPHGACVSRQKLLPSSHNKCIFRVQIFPKISAHLHIR
jgi:hypothetical protein